MGFYKIVSKQEFNSLFRFGQIPNNNIGNVNLNAKDIENSIFQCFTKIPYFEGDEEYLILKIEEDKDKLKIISITDILEVIPLTNTARKSFETKFDNRINFQEAIFEKIIQKVEQHIDIQDKIEGAKAIIKILISEQPAFKKIEDTIIEEAYIARIDGKKSQEIIKDFYTHLLVYERYNFSPNTDLGFFYDIGEAFANSKGQPTFKGSGLFNFLESNKANLRDKKLSEIITFIDSSDEIDSFKNQLLRDSIKMYISGVLYLKFKNEFLNKDSIKETPIPKITKWISENGLYNSELFDALYLLGGFYGFKKIYDDYYNILNLRFFKQEHFVLKVINDKYIVNKEDESKLKEPEVTITGTPLVENSISDRPGSTKETNQNIKAKDSAIEQIKGLFINKNAVIKIEKDLINELSIILKPFTKSNKSTKDKIIKIIKDEFINEFEMPTKYTLKIRTNPILFPNP